VLRASNRRLTACLDRLLIVGRRQLDHVLGVYVRHLRRRDLLGGLIHEYELAAA
jgi:hypothetical protein